MRIVMICPYSLSRPGGVQGQVAGLGRSLRRMGHEVAVLAPDRGQPGSGAAPGGSVDARGEVVPDGDGFDGVHVLGRPVGLHSNGSVAPVSLSPRTALRAERFVSRYRTDVVHLHEPMAPVAGYGCLLTRPAPMIGTYHRSGDSRWYGALRPLAGWANRQLDGRYAVSEEARRTAEKAMGGTCQVLFNGIEVTRFASAASAADAVAAADAGDQAAGEPPAAERPVIFFLGRHEARKGLGQLLEAFAQMPGPAVLWVAGDGPLTSDLMRRYPGSNRLRWLGVLGDEKVAERLGRAQVLCAPSLAGESFGMVLLEAMAARCSVVASDIPGYRAAAAGHAALVPVGDVAALARALTEAVSDAAGGTGASSPGALDAATAHARGWSMDRLAERYLGIYQEAIGSARVRGGDGPPPSEPVRRGGSGAV